MVFYGMCEIYFWKRPPLCDLSNFVWNKDSPATVCEISNSPNFKLGHGLRDGLKTVFEREFVWNTVFVGIRIPPVLQYVY